MSSAPRKPLAFTLLALALLVAGCRGSKHFQAGERAERVGRYDEAVSYYLRAVTEDPDNLHYRKSFERAKLRASAAHALEAARLLAAEEPKAALKEMELALSLNPTDGHLAEELEKLQAAVREKDEKAALTSIAALKEQAREKPLGRLRTTPGAEQPAGFIFRDASLRDVLLSVAKMAGVNVVFDSDFIDRRISIELRETTFEEALRSLCRITQNFFRVQEDHIVTIIPDTPAKRRAYQQQVMKTFYLSTADVKETIDLLRIVLGARRVAPLTASNAITMVDTPEKVAAAERIITVLDKSQAEVVVEVELLEVNRSRLTEYGIQFRSAGSEGIRAAVAPGDVTLDDSPYPRANLFATGLPGALLTLLRTDSETRVLANPQLRAVAGETAQAEFGERVPIPVTTFTPLATGGIEQQPVTTFQYQNVGVNIEITPRIHHNDEVSLQLRIIVDNISGTGFGNLPTFGNRSVDTVLRLRDGETSLLAGLITDEERTSLTGLPGLADLPIVGRLFSRNEKTVEETDVVLTLTPRIVRRADLALEDLRSYLIEGVAPAGLLYEPAAPPPRREPERQEKRP